MRGRLDIREVLRADPVAQEANSLARKVHTQWRLLVEELPTLQVGCPAHRRGRDYDFDDEILRLHKVQANLDRLAEIRLRAQSQRYSLRLVRDQVRDHLSSFDVIVRLRTKDERLAAIDAAMPKVTQRLGEIDLILEQVEVVYWNLLNTSKQLSEQRQAASKLVDLLGVIRINKGRKPRSEHL
jgi:hypothetical protein